MSKECAVSAHNAAWHIHDIRIFCYVIYFYSATHQYYDAFLYRFFFVFVFA